MVNWLAESAHDEEAVGLILATSEDFSSRTKNLFYGRPLRKRMDEKISKILV